MYLISNSIKPLARSKFILIDVLCQLQFPETPADLDNIDNQGPSEPVQSVNSGRQTSDQQATQNINENYANVERRASEAEDGQIEVMVITISNRNF